MKSILKFLFIYIPTFIFLLNYCLEFYLEPKEVDLNLIIKEGMKFIKLKDDRILEFYENDLKNETDTITIIIHDMIFSGHFCNLYTDYFSKNNKKVICPSIPGFGLSDLDPKHSLISFMFDIQELLLLKNCKKKKIEIIGFGTGNIYTFQFLKSFQNIINVVMVSPKRPLFNGTNYFDIFSGNLLNNEEEFIIKILELPFVSHYISHYVSNNLNLYYSNISYSDYAKFEKLKNFENLKLEIQRSMKRDFRIYSIYIKFIQNTNFEIFNFENITVTTNLYDNLSHTNHQRYFREKIKIKWEEFPITHFQIYQQFENVMEISLKFK